jgi:AraC-like DNA-binding protein
MVLIREGEAVLTHGVPPVRRRVGSGDVLCLRPGTPCAVEPDGMVAVTRVFLSAEYLLGHLVWRLRPLAPDLAAARLLAGRLYPATSRVVRLPDAAAPGVWRRADLVAALTWRRRLRADYYGAEAAMAGALGAVAPLLRRAEPGPGAARGDAAPDAAAGGGLPAVDRATLACMSMLRPLAPAVALARRLVQDWFDTDFTVADLAAAVGVSEPHLRRLFTEQMGKTPRAYRDSLRVLELTRLLAETGVSFEAAARRVGWRDPGQARSVFKRAVGLGPSAWREAFAGHVAAGPVSSEPVSRDGGDGPGRGVSIMFTGDLLIFQQ